MKTHLKPPLEIQNSYLQDGIPVYIMFCPQGHEVKSFVRDNWYCGSCRNIESMEYAKILRRKKLRRI